MSPETYREVMLQLQLLERLLAEFSPLRRKVQQVPPDLVEITALAGFLHSFYTGVESIFKRIADDPGQRRLLGEFWHHELLTAMMQSTAGSAAVISEALGNRLWDYLNFRHVFRHAYSFELQWSKMAPLVADSESVFAQLKTELERWLRFQGA